MSSRSFVLVLFQRNNRQSAFPIEPPLKPAIQHCKPRGGVSNAQEGRKNKHEKTKTNHTRTTSWAIILFVCFCFFYVNVCTLCVRKDTPSGGTARVPACRAAALPAKQDSYLLLPQSPFGHNLSQGLGFYWVVREGTLHEKEMAGSRPFREWYIDIYCLFFTTVCFNLFLLLRSLNKRGDLGVHAHYCFPPILAKYTQVSVCVYLRASLYIHVLLYASVCLRVCVYVSWQATEL